MEEFQGCPSEELEKPFSYCQALTELLEEHPSLRQQMDQFKQTAMQIKQNGKGNMNLESLYQQMRRFKVDIDLHSAKEEDGLFEMMVSHIGREGGPIAVMEEEHRLAKDHLGSFFKKYSRNVSEGLAIELAQHVLIVYQTLTDHFMKEEQILFPMAEQMLSTKEKEMLMQQFQLLSK
ncbi:hemerythrin domain-containing protein [Salipaludibacillus sp. HK11]|uniref:hemerythrin domain-containing protein n=1 Tax=Salipaludibacillus sp. HK11 TaxID=3394320 RepID=UPI0039FDB443